MSDSVECAHRVLNIILTKAAVSAKLTDCSLRVSYKDLLHSIGQPTDKDIQLVIKLTMSWDHSGTEVTGE